MENWKAKIKIKEEYNPLKRQVKLFGTVYLVSVWIQMKTQHFAFCVSYIYIFFCKECHKWDYALFSGSHALFIGLINIFLIKLLLKIDLTIFTHLKIILLQCFQFSIFSKISSIQTYPKVNKVKK